ncbi:MAG: ribulose-phosphate 3-epimerase [Erysipelotrichaceae bacterium]
MIVAPSVLSANFLNLHEQLEQVNKSKATWLHYDVMDGQFVPNISFGPSILKQIGSVAKQTIDVHLMVENPLEVVKYFEDCPIDYLTIHFEATDKYHEFVSYCHNLNIKAGLSIKPNTSMAEVMGVIDLFDLVLVMSVEPGFGNQKFMSESLEKIRYLNNRDHNYLIEVDGGINEQTIDLVKEAGVDVVVAGSYVFKGNIVEKIDSLL